MQTSMVVALVVLLCATCWHPSFCSSFEQGQLHRHQRLGAQTDGLRKRVPVAIRGGASGLKNTDVGVEEVSSNVLMSYSRSCVFTEY